MAGHVEPPFHIVAGDAGGIGEPHVKDLPFGTRVVVSRLDDGRSVTVRINDRGPFVRGRVIDLSYAAAKKLGMLRKGVVSVKVVRVD